MGTPTETAMEVATASPAIQAEVANPLPNQEEMADLDYLPAEKEIKRSVEKKVTGKA
ncbi:hypothetical protein [uncultured Roseibium sp.]|uniref:hypothetical protein n=1 Tax=uncultured Roseibium sp. TaxID=1936171 RepID=UPI002633BD98|nr:hypothetical protein [uncultured Roseibium sp.]